MTVKGGLMRIGIAFPVIVFIVAVVFWLGSFLATMRTLALNAELS